MAVVSASAPSNIALIKYMGKREGNFPTNASLSYTLDHLLTHVRLSPAESDQWRPLVMDQVLPLELSAKGRERYLGFLQKLKQELGLAGQGFLVESGNTFPSDCGIASSASSYAALTRAVAQWASEHSGTSYDAKTLSQLSRQGSGSSCRSFFSPWALWSEAGAGPVELPQTELISCVVLCDQSQKKVSSSEAHKRVVSSLLNQGRADRSESRLQQLLSALRQHDWEAAYQICWAEFWDMHALFETSSPSFGYMQASSLQTLERVRQHWHEQKDGPLVTMDAGANVHLLFRPGQRASMRQLVDELATLGLKSLEPAR